MASGESSYFLTMAQIAGTLLALSFVTLQFFLGDLLKRFESTALPVFRSRDFDKSAQPWHTLHPPESLKDEKLFDGDPLVIFMAFSVAVTWIQFLVPLTLSLTEVWLGQHPLVLAVELAFLICFFTFSFVVRNKAIKRLKPYLTRDELLWPVLGAVLLALYFAATATALSCALSTVPSVTRYLTIWNRWGVTNDHALLFVLKVVCILSLLIGTYTTNKDMFIFFKSRAAERMRERWLDSFVRERYPDMKKRVEVTMSGVVEWQGADLVQTWNDGCPDIVSTHDAFTKGGQTSLAKLWQNLLAGRSGVPIWLLDVPRIANWEAQVEELLNGSAVAATASVDAQTCGNISLTAAKSRQIAALVRALRRKVFMRAQQTWGVIAQAEAALEGWVRARISGKQ